MTNSIARNRLIARLQKALSPLESLNASKPYDFAELAERHRDVLMALSRDQHGVAVAFEGHQGLALTAAFDDLPGKPERSGLMVQLGDYPEVFQTAFGDRMVRRPESAERAAAHLWPVGSAADAIRPRHSRRAGRRRLAAGAADRSVAEPADAA